MQLDELFEGSLDKKMNFLSEKSKKNNDGIYRIDFSKVKDQKKGYRSVIRFLPNFVEKNKLGESAIEKMTHYVKMNDSKELSGYYDSPRNFGESCDLTKLYFNLKDSKNAILRERSQLLSFNKSFYSYVLIIEDEQQPELEGKIMIFKYGKTIREKILAESNGEITGVECNVFKPHSGKDFVMIVKEIVTGDISYPDYKMSMFRPNPTPMSIFSKEKKEFRKLPLTDDGKVDPRYADKLVSFLLDREYNLEDFAPKRLTEEQQGKVTEICNILTGKTSSSFSESSSPSSSDFDFEDNFNKDSSSSSTEDEDDFFSDL